MLCQVVSYKTKRMEGVCFMVTVQIMLPLVRFCPDDILITGASCMLPLLRFVWMTYLLLEMTRGITRLKKNLNKEFKANFNVFWALRLLEKSFFEN